MKLNEGLKVGDLSDLCLNTISIDQFKSKVNKDCIVIAFYILYKEPANDLNSFIQKTAMDIIDTDISDSPTEDGYYIVFLELERNNKFPQRLQYIVDSIKELTNINEWYFRCYNNKNPEDLNLDNIKKYIDYPRSNKDIIENYLKNSVVDSIIFEGDKIILKKGVYDKILEFVAFGNTNSIVKKFNLVNKPFVINENSMTLYRSFNYFLGEGWDCNQIENYLIISNNFTDKSIIIKAS